jgi:hypothetical protein
MQFLMNVMLLKLLLFLCILKYSSPTKIKVCLTPSVPALTYDQKNEPVPITFQKNEKKLGPWKGENSLSKFKPLLTGFLAELLPKVMDRAAITSYEMYVYPSFGELLYHTSTTGLCDVAFTTFTVTADRLRCQNYTSNTGVQGCVKPKDDNKILSKHGCCSHFGVPFFSDTIGAIIKKGTNRVTIFHALWSIQVLNIISFCIVAIVIFAHLVWFFERVDNPEQFPPSYIDGIDDAIWWSCTTVTTVGYGDKYPITNGGRLIALLWMFSGVIFLGLFAGAVSSSMASQARAASGISNLNDLDAATSLICTTSTYYGRLFLDPINVKHYRNNVNNNLLKCINDLKDGVATGVLYDSKYLKYHFKIDPTLSKDYVIIPGLNEVLMAPSFSSTASSNPMISNSINSAITELKTEKFYYKTFKFCQCMVYMSMCM